MSFCTAINCMDGRTQEPVIDFMKRRFGVEYVDLITEPGPNRILAEDGEGELTRSILNRVAVSVERHASVGIAVIGHFDCAGNPAPEGEQNGHTAAAVEFLKRKYPDLPVIGLWVGRDFAVGELVVD